MNIKKIEFYYKNGCGYCERYKQAIIKIQDELPFPVFFILCNDDREAVPFILIKDYKDNCAGKLVGLQTKQTLFNFLGLCPN